MDISEDKEQKAQHIPPISNNFELTVIAEIYTINNLEIIEQVSINKPK